MRSSLIWRERHCALNFWWRMRPQYSSDRARHQLKGEQACLSLYYDTLTHPHVSWLRFNLSGFVRFRFVSSFLSFLFCVFFPTFLNLLVMDLCILSSSPEPHVQQTCTFFSGLDYHFLTLRQTPPFLSPTDPTPFPSLIGLHNFALRVSFLSCYDV